MFLQSLIGGIHALDVPQVASLVGCTTQTISKRIADGTIPSFRASGVKGRTKVFVMRSDALAFKESFKPRKKRGSGQRVVTSGEAAD